MKSTQHIVMFSGGVGSWAAAKRVKARLDRGELQGDLVLLFTDTLIEDEDTYRFLDEAAVDVGAPLVRIAEGRTPWQVFFDERYIGNSRIDPCSKILKREEAMKWLGANCERDSTVVYLGIDWTEEHRFKGARARYEAAGWELQAPLCERPLMTKGGILALARSAGIRQQRLYDWAPHANCGGFCVKAGHAHFRALLVNMPERYAHHEAQEAAWQATVGKPNTILRDRRGGKTRPLTLKTFRERIEAEERVSGTGCAVEGVDDQEWGGCGCFTGAAGMAPAPAG